MAFKLPSRVLETFTTTGTGTVTLAGAVSGYKTFASELSNADTCFYFMEAQAGGTDYEIGYGTYSGSTLARTTVLKSSNSNNAVNWAAGTKIVGIAPLGPSSLDATNLKRLMDTLLGSNTLSVPALLDISAAAAGQIKFPATQNASADANTLDDYEEGTFTPVINGLTLAGAGTYSLQTGTYVKIGKCVAFQINLVWSAHTGTGNMGAAGMPFTSAGGSWPIANTYSNLTYASPLLTSVAGSATTVSLTVAATGAAVSNIPIDTAATINVGGTYFV